MSKILSISTVNNDLIVFIQDGNTIVDSVVYNEKSSHSKFLVYIIDEILKKNFLDYSDIDCFSAINGPGSFIGIKVSISFIKALKSIYKDKKIILNSVFDVLSFCNVYDYIILKADFRNYYIFDKHKNINISNSIDEFLNGYKTIIGKDIDIKSISSLNYHKYSNGIFSDNIEPLYIREPQINKK